MIERTPHGRLAHELNPMDMEKDLSDQKPLKRLTHRQELEALKEGLRQADRGEGISLEEWYRKMQEKYKLPDRK